MPPKGDHCTYYYEQHPIKSKYNWLYAVAILMGFQYWFHSKTSLQLTPSSLAHPFLIK